MRTVDNDELRTIQLGILKHVHNFCDEKKIKYFMCGGTLLGAVRHKGFIPWDDDIDIMMLRTDYERFLEEYPNHQTEYKLYSIRNYKKYPHTYAKVSDERTCLIEEMHGAISIGVNIDVFPIDDLPDDKKKISRIVNRNISLINMLLSKQLIWRKERSLWKNIIIILGRICLSPISCKTLINQIERNAISYHGVNGSKCADLVAGYGEKEIQDRSNLAQAILIPFESEKFYGPIGYDNYLKGLYGDYMQLPPVEKRISTHTSHAFWK